MPNKNGARTFERFADLVKHDAPRKMQVLEPQWAELGIQSMYQPSISAFNEIVAAAQSTLSRTGLISDEQHKTDCLKRLPSPEEQRRSTGGSLLRRR